jgi:hypothetical protein
MALKHWSLLPCTEIQFDADAVPLSRINEVWNPATVYICECLETDGTETIVFAVSCGRLISNPQVGDGYEVSHYDTDRTIGTFTVLNVVDLRGGKIIKTANNKNLSDLGSVMVFK